MPVTPPRTPRLRAGNLEEGRKDISVTSAWPASLRHRSGNVVRSVSLVIYPSIYHFTAIAIHSHPIFMICVGTLCVRICQNGTEGTEILEILSSMGVQIPKNSGELLDRLTDALNAAQNGDWLPIMPRLDPHMAQGWPMRLRPRERESVKWAVWRGSEEERNVMLWRPHSSKWWNDPFWGLRQTMTILAHTIDIGCHWVTIRDPTRRMRLVITIRLLPTLEIDVGIPGIVLAYKAWDPFDVPFTLVLKSFPIGEKMMNISASRLEIKLMLHLLAINATLLPYSYRATAVEVLERQSVSILLPIGPLSFRDRDRLGNDSGCMRCGNERWVRCSQCHSVSYCSAACQWTDWPAHKPTCLSLKGGKWHSVPFRVYPPGEGGLASACSYYLNMNFRRPWTASNPTWPEDNLPPPNIHGARTFLVKLQAPLVVWTHPAFLIYDEQHSFDQVFFYAEDSPSIYAAIVQEMQSPRGGNGGNMYRLARRTGDRELTVCLDREPIGEIEW